MLEKKQFLLSYDLYSELPKIIAFKGKSKYQFKSKVCLNGKTAFKIHLGLLPLPINYSNQTNINEKVD